ncbi:MAG: sigma-54-dependent Fis family transcriptional regulator [Desulfobacterales bacterium]|nr:sigma-54-dependent Fis family transcriptional regulator [Desulfobacterales bacterium]
MAHILIVDDEAKMRHLLSLMLQRKGHKTTQAGDGIEALQLITSTPFDMVISDIKMPNLDGLGLLKEVKHLDIACPIVFITAFADIESAVESMREGAVDYITKPFEEDRIHFTVERTIKLSRIIAENLILKKEIHELKGSNKIVYASKKMEEIIDLASKVAKSDSVVLITGESGTGKEILARFIHDTSNRAKGRFVPVNCAAISANLVESELFGYEKGAFTGADKKAQGKFEFSSGGTIFLDEIGELPIEAQAKLLRVLQEKRFQRVGGNEEIPVDVRVIFATNKNLQEEVRKNNFRQDLFFRINVFPIHSPSLRERNEDIIPLAKYFLSKLSGNKIDFTDGALRVLTSYTWPGNVRELANAVERASILSGCPSSISADTLSFLKLSSNTNNICLKFQIPPEGISLEELEKDLVRQALSATQYNQTAAGKLLGLTRGKFRVLMKQLGKD